MSVQEHIDRILWDRRIVTFPIDLEKPNDIDYVILKNPTLEDRNIYLRIRNIEEHKARQAGVPTEGEIMANAREGGYWTKVEDDIESQADDHIAYLESEFEAKKKFRSRQNIIKLQIEDAEAKKQWVARKRSELKQKSAEYMAHEVAAFSLLCRVALGPDNCALIPDDQTLLSLKKDYPVFVYFLVQEMLSEGVLDIPTIREIARSSEWRLVWGLSRENLPSIFNRTVGDMTMNDKLLIYWSRVYDSALESHEPPDQEILEDDERFDEWLADKDLERKEKAREGRSRTSDHQEQGQMLDGEYIERCTCGMKQKNAGKPHAVRMPHAEDCQYGTWHKFTKEEKERRARYIYGRNASNIRQVMDAEQERIINSGAVEEQDLRNKKTRNLYGMPTKVTSVKR